MNDPDYRLWWEQEARRRAAIERILDRVLGESADDGAGLGLVADVALAITTAWDQGYSAGISAPANRALGLGNPENPYVDLKDS